MAKVIERYIAEAGGSSTMYYYEYPDNTSEATRIYTGETIYLSAKYAEKMVDDMYYMVDPAGWIHWYHVQNIQPVYRTVTGACTPPASVVLQTESKTLVINGGAGGDLNDWAGFGISWRDRAITSSTWGSWSADSVSVSRTVSVEAPSGMVRQFRVRTLGTAGSNYNSSYTVCETLMSGNTAAGMPVVLLPVSGANTCSAVTVVKINCPAEPDGDAMVLQRRINGGVWTDAACVAGSGGVVYDQLSLSTGSYTLGYRLVDINGEAGGVDSISFVCWPLLWQRGIQPGDIIANREISFVADIQEMLDYVNQLCVFYGRPPVQLPGTPGKLADWRDQLQTLQNAVDKCRNATGRGNYGFKTPDGWPGADEINQLRSAIGTT